MLVELAAANPPTPHRTGKKRPPAPGNSAGLRGVAQWRVQLPVVISVVISDVANQKGKRPCPSFSGDHHPQQVVGSSSKNAHGERLSFGSVVNLLLLYICVAMRGALRVRRARTHHQYPSRPPSPISAEALARGVCWCCPPRRVLDGRHEPIRRCCSSRRRGLVSFAIIIYM